MSPTPVYVLNQRTYFLYLLRNLNLLLLTLFTSINAYSHFPRLTSNHTLLDLVSRKLFVRGSSLFFLKAATNWKFFHTLNINKSLEFAVMHRVSSFLSTQQLVPFERTLVFAPLRLCRLQYYTYFLFSNISLHYKVYRAVLIKLLLTLFTTWDLWSRHFAITLKFIVGKGDFFLLYFANIYIFKLYHM